LIGQRANGAITCAHYDHEKIGAGEISSGFATGSVRELQMVCHAPSEIFDGSFRNFAAEICCD
jgi:hypothetical protein